ncbi:MAG: MaoC family dehydratase [Flammeovirgaceae bacterium]|nr:MaoC family dehydratase [Flammeovirgaceae bacterium]
MSHKIKVGDNYEYEFSFTQEDVEAFARLSGDNNPVHLDPEFASKTIFKQPIIHGFLSASVFSKVLGTDFPGHGCIYLKQSMDFLRPMYVNLKYKAKFTVEEINEARHQAIIKTIVLDLEKCKTTISGSATVMHKERL